MDLRVAKWRALTNESVLITGTIESTRFGSQGFTDCDGSLSGEERTNAMGMDSEAPGELGTGDGNAIEDLPM